MCKPTSSESCHCPVCEDCGWVYDEDTQEQVPCDECLTHGCGAYHKPLAELVREHNSQCERERDHHGIQHCQCSLAAQHYGLWVSP